MNSDVSQWLFLILSFAYIFLIIGVASLLMRYAGWPARVTRKIVHIGVAHWWLLALVGIQDLRMALIGPLSFIVLNTLSYRLRLIAAMEPEEGRSNLGTIYFPVSLTVLVTLCWGGYLSFTAGTIGVLILGWGDGLAALVGETWGRVRFRVPGGTKSLEGTATMMICSFLVTFFTLLITAYGAPLQLIKPSLLIAVAATLVEVVTPRGMDNLSVPLFSALLAGSIL